MFEALKKLFSSPRKPTAAKPALNSDEAAAVPSSPSVTRGGGLFGTALGGYDQPGMNAPHMQSLLQQMDRSDDDGASKGCCLPSFGSKKR